VLGINWITLPCCMYWQQESAWQLTLCTLCVIPFDFRTIASSSVSWLELACYQLKRTDPLYKDLVPAVELSCAVLSIDQTTNIFLWQHKMKFSFIFWTRKQKQQKIDTVKWIRTCAFSHWVYLRFLIYTSKFCFDD
jgi:hypothetical protein